MNSMKGLLLLALSISLGTFVQGRVVPRASAKERVRFLPDQRVVSIPENSPLSVDDLMNLREPGLIYETCRVLNNVGEVCIGLYGDPTAVPSSLGVELKFMNRTFLVPVLNAQACLNDEVLLSVLASNPRFEKLAKQIQLLIAAEKLLGAVVVSECVMLTDVDFFRVFDGGYSFSACPELHSDWGCFRDRCLHAKINKFDCFAVKIPPRGQHEKAK